MANHVAVGGPLYSAYGARLFSAFEMGKPLRCESIVDGYIEEFSQRGEHGESIWTRERSLEVLISKRRPLVLMSLPASTSPLS
jgi:hypothetical protein